MPSTFRSAVARKFVKVARGVGYSKPQNVRLGYGDGTGRIVYDAAERLVWFFEGTLGGEIYNRSVVFVPADIGLVLHDSTDDENTPIQIRYGPGETLPQIFKLNKKGFIANAGRTPADQARDRAAIPALAQLDTLRLRVVPNSNAVKVKGLYYYDQPSTGERRHVLDPVLDLAGDIELLDSGDQQLALVYFDTEAGVLKSVLGSVVNTSDPLPKKSTFKDFHVANLRPPAYSIPLMAVYLYFEQALVDGDLYREYDPRPLFTPIVRHVYGATAAPTATDDESVGFGVGSWWIYGDDVYVCTDPTEGVANWEQVNGTGGGGGSGGGIDSGVYASLPAAGNAGAAYLPTDSYYWMIDNGAAWDARGPIFRCVVPPASGWSWDNQGTATIDITRGSHSLNAPGATGLQLRGRYRAAPTPPYKITAQLIASMPGVAHSTVGLYFRQASDGKMACYSLNGQMLMLSQTFSNPSGGSVSNYLVGGDTAPYLGMGYPRFMRIEDDGTNRICSWSYDGVNFVVFHSVSRTDYLTADQVGFYVFVNSSSESLATLLSWEVS